MNHLLSHVLLGICSTFNCSWCSPFDLLSYTNKRLSSLLKRHPWPLPKHRRLNQKLLQGLSEYRLPTFWSKEPVKSFSQPIRPNFSSYKIRARSYTRIMMKPVLFLCWTKLTYYIFLGKPRSNASWNLRVGSSNLKENISHSTPYYFLLSTLLQRTSYTQSLILRGDWCQEVFEGYVEVHLRAEIEYRKFRDVVPVDGG